MTIDSYDYNHEIYWFVLFVITTYSYYGCVYLFVIYMTLIDSKTTELIHKNTNWPINSNTNSLIDLNNNSLVIFTKLQTDSTTLLMSFIAAFLS